MTKKLTAKQKEAMRKGRKKSRELCGLVLKIDDDISIWADVDQYIVKYGSRHCFFGSLEHCFNDIFESKVKVNLIKSKEKEIKEVIRIIKETSKWLKNIFRTIENPTLTKN